jgi:Zn finger protein HypA/HybF involved in hydrogenase expression
MKAVKVTEADYEEAVDSYTGWCKTCKAFTTSCVEPDAEDYECEACGANTVVGAEDALMLGLITFGEGNEDEEE